MNTDLNKQVLIYSDPNFLALGLLENLLVKGYVVNIVSKNKNTWLQKTELFKYRTNILFTNLNNYTKVSNFSNAIFCGGFINHNSVFADFKLFISNKFLNKAKTLALFPMDCYSEIQNKSIIVNKQSGVLFIGDLMGPEIDLNSNLLIPTLINEMINKQTLTLAVGEIFSPLLVNDVAKTVVNKIDSMDLYGKQTFIEGDQLLSSEFCKQNLKYFSKLKIIYNTKYKSRSYPININVLKIHNNFSALLNLTYRWLSRKNNVTKMQQLKTSKPSLSTTNTTAKKVLSIKHNKNIAKYLKLPSRFKYLRTGILVLLAIFLLPLFLIFIASIFLYFSYKSFMTNDLVSLQKSALLAKAVFVIGNKESNLLSKIPVANNVYKETAYITYIGINTSDIFVNTFPVVKTTSELLDNILNNKQYDVKLSAAQIKSGLDYLYKQLNFIQIETEDNSKKNVLSAKQVLNIIDFDKLRNYIQQGSVLISNMPQVLGSDGNKSYLALFQNNMELRPTGGFIGSYGILNFGSGKLNNLTINDIYSADGQLKGHIEPPTPIKDYLGEANWFFRDSNWNPDFPTSALRAEWFLNKEVGQLVDGTVAIDLYPLMKILNYTGPIFLPDYNLTLDSKNLYEKTQQESEAGFFPGSRKKASFLTALARAMVGELGKLNNKQKLGVIKTIFESLESRNIQINLNDKKYQEPIENLGWSGGIPIYSCGNGCYSDFVGDVEANLGVNKSNYFISRKLNLNIDIDSNQVVRNLNIVLKNSANPALGASGIYKTYLRIIIPLDARLTEARLLSGQNNELLKVDIEKIGQRQEVGVYIEILPGENRTVKFTWKSDLLEDTKIDKYGLFVRKQAGTDGDIFNLELNSKMPILEISPIATLTKQGAYAYNTILSKDFFTRMSFKK